MLRLSREAQARPADLHELADGMALVGDAPNGPVMFGENGLRFAADLLRGQKTGFFLDQRDNRARVERLAAGRRTLNVFAYTGGFSLYAARGGAPTVTSVDISAGALADAERNFALNRDDPGVAAAQHVTLAGDAFRVLADLRAQGRKFDLVIVDPPALAVREGQAAGALDAYARLTRLALGVAAPGGALMLASCSARVPSDDFYAAVLRAATMAGRPLTEIERTGHALDHPIGFPEGAYLKALFAFAP
jgi:23S rRNA (cytosine1962-C5)-methyltransferase